MDIYDINYKKVIIDLKCLYFFNILNILLFNKINNFNITFLFYYLKCH